MGLVGYYRKFIKGFAKIAKPLTLLTRQQVKFDWKREHQAAFRTSEKTPLSRHQFYITPTPTKLTLYTLDASDDACGAQLSQEHNGTEFPIAFLSHTFSETQHKWSTTEARSFWSVLHNNQMELLPPGSQHNCPEMTINH